MYSKPPSTLSNQSAQIPFLLHVLYLRRLSSNEIYFRLLIVDEFSSLVKTSQM